MVPNPDKVRRKESPMGDIKVVPAEELYAHRLGRLKRVLGSYRTERFLTGRVVFLGISKGKSKETKNRDCRWTLRMVPGERARIVATPTRSSSHSRPRGVFRQYLRLVESRLEGLGMVVDYS